ncbi:hypothetical protein [Streptomyces sp. NPDC006132]|uniref:hypothetical protein n=1 Tax=Streptomyces sp. NPDC006132 TaxID=3156732 RepID=UPI0033CE2467
MTVQGRHGQPVGVEGLVPQQQGLGALRVRVVEAARGDGVVGEVVGVEAQEVRVEVGSAVRRHVSQRGGDRDGIGGQEHRADVVVEDLDGLVTGSTAATIRRSTSPARPAERKCLGVSCLVVAAR